jgi:hypothetical protein
MPNITKSSLLPGLCDILPLHDVFFKRMIKLVYNCLNSPSSIVNFVLHRCILCGRMNSIPTMGRHVVSCCGRYYTFNDSITYRTFSPIKYVGCWVNWSNVEMGLIICQMICSTGTHNKFFWFAQTDLCFTVCVTAQSAQSVHAKIEYVGYVRSSFGLFRKLVMLFQWFFYFFVFIVRSNEAEFDKLFESDVWRFDRPTDQQTGPT